MKDPKTLLTSPSPDSKVLSALLENSTEGLKISYLITTAWEIGLFEHTTSPKNPKTIAQELGGYHETMMGLFCDALVEVGLLTKQDDTYLNASLTSTYLCRNSPHYLSQILKNTQANINRWTQLPQIIKNGPLPHVRTDFFNENWLIGIAEWAAAGAVANTLRVVSEHIDPQPWRRLLDLGGGHGLYAIAFTALNPNLAAYVFDLPKMMQVTQKYVKEYDAQRVHILPGDFYKDSIGQDYDVIFSSFNQSCSDPNLLGKMVEALVPGGYVVLRRFTDASREGALKTLDWNLLGFEGKKIGSKSHSSDAVMDQKTYLEQLENMGLSLLGTFPLDKMSEITIARKLLNGGSRT
ncbi:MAG: acetylserotonin O-methyltransferase [Candidatus Bathyarchaeota archaeon]|nr:acetylserotonin O-methyltransferase [Candidatus Bathyarchaeota archaeon]